ncbi:hypothetical protein [Pedococcus bigeumensis]|uniref:hypothetical protein n=1 Tax=Pedococcus bigeumensis TaxID=433644 RepID=UPI00112AB610|nr:hypothetical protein [Pedococcus bigeumensis]
MSQPFHVAAQPDPPKPPIVRLPTWVNVVLVLILLASCGGDRLSAGSVADEVVQRLGTNGSGDSSYAGVASQDDVIDMCRLLGAVAARQKISPSGVMSPDSVTQCHEAAQQAATTP